MKYYAVLRLFHLLDIIVTSQREVFSAVSSPITLADNVTGFFHH